jgi:hypothetical protein
MQPRLFAVCLSVCLLTPAARAADPENPYKSAKVGDWVSYKMSPKIQGNAVEMTMKMTVDAKDDKEVTVKATVMYMGQEGPPQTIKIDLSKPFDPIKGLGASVPQTKDTKVEKVEDGKETITVGDKKYDCTWTKFKSTTKIQDKEIKSDVKIWVNKDVPLGGLVKMEMTGDVFNSTMMLADHGKGK